MLNIYRFKFDIKKTRDLRDAINDREKFSIESESYVENGKTGPKCNAWNRLCAAMTRLEDTIDYINKMELGKIENGQSAYDFYDFINCAYVAIECIKIVVWTFNIDNTLIDNIEKSTDVFGTKYSETGNDGRFFEYIRSLCGVHPICTNRQREYLKGSLFHCCPFVAWTDRGYVDSRQYGGADLIAHVYTTGDIPITIKLYIKEFEKYLAKWIDCIPEVIDGKHKCIDEKYEILKKEHVKTLSDFDGEYIKYIENLRDEYIKRFDCGHDYVLNEYIKIFKIKLSNKDNQVKLEKYKKAILYSLEFLRNGLQNMDFKRFENTGIKCADIETSLYIELGDPDCNSGAFNKYSYVIQKACNLELGDGLNKDFVRRLLESTKELINQYVVFTNTESDEEAYILIKLALYLEALTRDSIINKNIPNDSLYRENLLSQTEIEQLHKKKTEIKELKENECEVNIFIKE